MRKEKLLSNKEIIEKLDSNMNLELSLASLELYHSNFIAYIIKNYQEIPLVFLKDFIDIENVKIERVERERKNIDLTLHLNDGTKVIIENKMKDYPNREQLEKYSRDNPDVKLKVLLVPFKINNTTLPKDWKIIHYRNIVEYLDHIKGSQFATFIDDYKNLCTYLEVLFKSINTNISTSRYGDIYPLMNEAKKLRLDSAIERIFRNSMLDKIDSKFKPYFGRGTGKHYFGGIVHLDENFSIDVQLEKNDYRHKLNIPREKVRDSAFIMAKELKDLNYVFNFSSHLEPRRGGEWNQYGLGRLEKSFDVYNSPLKLKANANGLDIYTYAKIPNELPNQQIVDLINRDLHSFERNKYEILEVIYKYINE
ncbi:hypothetical protein NOL38_01780 [Streptococcus suis]|uniref:hypothetical protein n=1 Tax=Streptococcus suis TaxID=1307 RepID=UPI002412E755|nr:hypothetical protein [Streptococcus suis]MDG4504994.1 hypothetical protein [Streptococcus suis]